MDFDLLGLGSGQTIQPKKEKVPQIRLDDEKEKLKKELVPNFKLLNEHIRGRIDDILTLLLSAADKSMLQTFSRSGLLEQTPLLRAHVWKRNLSNIVLVESLPLRYARWNEVKQENYKSYLKLLQGQMHIDHDDLLGMQEAEDCFDQALWDEIVLDTKRTHSSLNFFQTEVKEIKVYATRPTKHCDILTRILYVWAKVNCGVRYVQGMNEILAPLYYLQFQQIKKESESEVFYLFSALIAPVIDMHIKDMDKSDHGIMGRMNTLNKYLKAVDYELWEKLDSESVNPQFYSFRWLALMLSQQFGLYETMRIWDILFSYDGQKRLCYLYCLCLGIMKLRKKDIMQSDFGNILPRLHKLKDLQVSEVIEIANKLFQKVVNVDIDKLLQRQQQRREMEAQKAKNQISYTNFYKKTQNVLSMLQKSFSGKK